MQRLKFLAFDVAVVNLFKLNIEHRRPVERKMQAREVEVKD